MSSMPDSRTLPLLIDELVARHGEREAVVGSGERLTYRQLADRVDRVAARLIGLGIQRGDRVGILMGNQPDWIVGVLAIARIGGWTVSLNSWSSARELAYLLKHSECRCLITVKQYLKYDYAAMLRDMAPEDRPDLRYILGVGNDLPDGWLPLYAGDAPPDAGQMAQVRDAAARVTPDDPVLLLYTSGSTSAPKGVQMSHGPLIVNAWHIGERQGVVPGDRLWMAVSLFWALGVVNAMMNLLTHGGCIVLQPSFDAGEALRLIERERCTLFYGTPNMAQALEDHPARHAHDLSSLRGGGTLGSVEQIERVIGLGATQVSNMYGLTETYGNSHVSSAAEDGERRILSCGRPLPGIAQRIVGADDQEVPPGEVGEIRVKGRVADAYFKNPALTAASFDEQGYFKTGDLGHVDEEGYLYYHGRMKELIKTGGINVAPADVEAVLSAHPDVYLAYVVGMPDAVRDEEIAALIVLNPGVAGNARALIDHCKKNLAAYKVPRRVKFVRESDLPVTTTGKVQKNRLVETFFQAV